MSTPLTTEQRNKVMRDLLINFKKQYPSVTSADLQSFILGMKAILDCNDLSIEYNKIYYCNHCNAIKLNDTGLCSNCGKFPNNK